jgi:Sec-independent protein translocase protein TatA
LLVIGPKKLPELARSLGKGLAEFRRASTEMRREFLEVADEVRIDPPTQQTPEQSKSEPKSESNPDPEPESEPKSESSPDPESESEPKSESSPDPEPESESESESERADKTKPAAEPKGSKVG